MSLGLKNTPQVPGDRAKVGQNHDARKAVSATLSVLSEVGLYFELLDRNIAPLYIKLIEQPRPP